METQIKAGLPVLNLEGAPIVIDKRAAVDADCGSQSQKHDRRGDGEEEDDGRNRGYDQWKRRQRWDRDKTVQIRIFFPLWIFFPTTSWYIF